MKLSSARFISGLFLFLLLILDPVKCQASDIEVIEVTYEEAQELMKIAWCEAGNQGIEGQRYVMSVILNRVASEDFPNSIHDVIYQPSQFAVDGMESADITWETHYALAQIEMGYIIPQIIAFETKDSNVLDTYYSEAFAFKNHKFYTKKIK